MGEERHDSEFLKHLFDTTEILRKELERTRQELEKARRALDEERLDLIATELEEPRDLLDSGRPAEQRVERCRSRNRIVRRAVGCGSEERQ